jgi:hypothetical protein
LLAARGPRRIATARPLKELPDGVQNAAELVLDWFVAQARRIDPRNVPIIAPFLASLFLVILSSNLLAVLPIPVLQIPPTAHYSAPLALAAIAVLGTLVISARLRGIAAGLKHLVWPNPLQLVSELSHALALAAALRQHRREFIVALLVQAVPYGIPCSSTPSVSFPPSSADRLHVADRQRPRDRASRRGEGEARRRAPERAPHPQHLEHESPMKELLLSSFRASPWCHPPSRPPGHAEDLSTALEDDPAPEIAPQLFTSMLVSMALVEALVIYCLVIALMMAAKV